jgi:hypothetical protein
VSLSLLIIASLVPHPRDDLTDIGFLVVFGVEFILRGLVFLGAMRAATPDSGATRVRRNALGAFLLVLDLLAVLSFLPWQDLLGEVTWLEGPLLRIVRLLRLWILIGYWSPMLRDALAVMSRHDRLKQLAILGLLVAIFALAGATVLSHIPVAVDFDGDTHLDADDTHFWPRLWWAFRQIQDPGNLVVDPGEIAVVAISLVLTVAGLFVVSFLIGLATDTVRELVDVARNRPVGWRGHTVIVGAPPYLPRFLADLSAHYERLFRRPRFVVADTSSEAPPELRGAGLGHVKWRLTDDRGTRLVELTDAARARRVVIHAHPEAPFPDAQVAATVLDVREANADLWIVAEVLEPHSAAAVRVAGGGRTVPVPTETLVGIWALAEVRRPEQLSVAWDLLVTRGGFEIYTYFFDGDGLDGPGHPWHAGATTFEDLVASGLARAPRRRAPHSVMPLGVIRARPGDAGRRNHELGELLLNPPSGRPLADGHPIRALVGIGEQFKDLRGLGDRLFGGDHVGAPPLTGGGPALDPPSPALKPRKILLCGFRAATVVTCAGLCAEGADVEVTLVMRHEESLAIASEAFREHGERTSSGGAIRCFAGEFRAESDRSYRWHPSVGAVGGRVTLVQADWSSGRTLSGAEAGIAHVGAHDLVMLLGAHLPEYDGRTAMAVLKIADLMRLEPTRFIQESKGFRVVCGVADADLGRRLAEGFKRTTGRGLAVIPTEALRAQFMFQAIAVPGWESIYSELLGPGGQGLRRHAVSGDAPEREWELRALMFAYRAVGLLVIGVELNLAGELIRKLLPRDMGARFSSRDLVAVWAIGADEPSS